MVWLTVAARLSLSGLMLLAGLSKVIMHVEFRQTVERVVVIPSAWVRPLATSLPFIELVLGVGLIIARTSAMAAAAAMLIFSAFAVVTGLQLWLTEDRGSCNCYWNADRLSWKMPVRNVACALIAATIAWPQWTIAFDVLGASLLLVTMRDVKVPSGARARRATAT